MRINAIHTALGICTGVYVIFFFYYARWDSMVVKGGDSWGYYSYLPAAGIHGDIEDLQSVLSIRQSLGSGSVYADSLGILRAAEAPSYGRNNVIKYSCGLAMMYLPYFIVGHSYALVSSSHAAHGYSLPYIFSLYSGTLIYILLGLYLLSRVLAQIYRLRSVALAIIVIALGTNLFYFGVFNNVMAHGILFFLWSGLIYCTDRYYRDREELCLGLVGLCVGMITLIRPTELIAVAVPIFWNISSLRGFTERVRQFMEFPSHVLVCVLMMFLPFIPQILYWHDLTGQWIYYSYTHEGFDFTSPQIVRGIFGYMNGWLAYSPIMYLSIIGLLWMLLRGKRNSGLLFIITAIHIYIIYSWWNWYYINGFGSRPMVDIYPLLIFPVAYLLDRVVSPWVEGIMVLVVSSLSLLSIFQIWQESEGIIRTEFGSGGMYIEAFLDRKFSRDISIALDMNTPQSIETAYVDRVYREDFEQADMLRHRDSVIVKDGRYAYRISGDAERDFGRQRLRLPEDIDYTSDRHYLEIRVDVYVNRQIGSWYDLDNVAIAFMRNNRAYKNAYLRLNNKTGSEDKMSFWWAESRVWTPVRALLVLPKRWKSGDEIEILIHHPRERSEVIIDNIEIDLVKQEGFPLIY